MKEVIQNDNISTQDRITILKARLKEKKKWNAMLLLSQIP
jgi:hypothetical protein